MAETGKNGEARTAGEPVETPLRRCLLAAGEILLTLWALGLFYHYYQSLGYFQLVRSLLGWQP